MFNFGTRLSNCHDIIEIMLRGVQKNGYQFMFRARMCRSLIFDRVEDWDQRTGSKNGAFVRET